jgi:hypothetical protein
MAGAALALAGIPSGFSIMECGRTFPDPFDRNLYWVGFIMIAFSTALFCITGATCVAKDSLRRNYGVQARDHEVREGGDEIRGRRGRLPVKRRPDRSQLTPYENDGLKPEPD